MPINKDQKLIKVIQQEAIPLDSSDNLDQLLHRMGDASIVLIGGGGQGTHDFYHLRAEITKRLIIEKGFMAIAIEDDWPDVHQIHRYVQSTSENVALNPLEKFKKFPEWIWRNVETLSFLHWLRTYNILYANDQFPIELYGLDLYSLNIAIDEILSYLESVDPEEATKAQQRYSCFNLSHIGLQKYNYKVSADIDKLSNEAVLAQWSNFNKRRDQYLSSKEDVKLHESFNAWQNRGLITNAELYFQGMYYPGVSAWNLRAHHMFKVLQELSLHLKTRWKKPAKIIVWAHNSQVGDLEATELTAMGQINLGKLVKNYYGQQSFSLAFTTYQGEIVAADQWNAPMGKVGLNPALLGSYEDLFHQIEYGSFLLSWPQGSRIADQLAAADPHLFRSIGVIYHPDWERYSHYYYSYLHRQFDAVIHLDKTSAIHALANEFDD